MIQHLQALGIGAAVVVGLLAANTFIENPLIEKLATEKANHATTILVTNAANQAREAAEDHYERVGQAALDEYRKVNSARESLQRQVVANLEQDISNYEHALEAAGRSCRFTRDDFVWVRSKPGGAASPNGR